MKHSPDGDLDLLKNLEWLQRDVESAKKNVDAVANKLDGLCGRIGVIEARVRRERVERVEALAAEKKQEIVTQVEPAIPEEPTVPKKAPSPEIHPPMPSVVRAERKVSTSYPEPAADSAAGAAELQFGQKWLLLAGLAIMVLGIGYFLKYSFDNNWVSPATRVSMAFLTGVGCLGLGETFRRKGLGLFGLCLVGGGIATLYSSTFAAFGIYELIPQTLAFATMVLVTALACGLALHYDAKWLSVLGLVGGFATPVILSTGAPNHGFLMAYLAVLNTGVLSIALFKRWGLLHNLGFFFTWAMTAIVVIAGRLSFAPTLFFVNLFFLLYTLVPYGFYLLRKGEAKLRNLALSLPTACFGFGLSYALIVDEYSRVAVTFLTLSYAALYLGLAHVLCGRDLQNKSALVMLLGKASIFLVLTVPVLFTGNWITLFWALEALALFWIAHRLADFRAFVGSVMVLGLALVKTFRDYEEVFGLNLNRFVFDGGYNHLLLDRGITVIAVLFSLFAFSKYVGKGSYLKEKSARDLPMFFGSLFIVALFCVLNVEVLAFFGEVAPAATKAAVSVLWTLFAVALMVLGFTWRRQALRQTSIGLICLTIIKVFFNDMATVSTPYRVLSLIVLGTMMVGASYLYHRYSDRILDLAEKGNGGKQTDATS